MGEEKEFEGGRIVRGFTWTGNSRKSCWTPSSGYLSVDRARPTELIYPITSDKSIQRVSKSWKPLNWFNQGDLAFIFPKYKKNSQTNVLITVFKYMQESQ